MTGIDVSHWQGTIDWAATGASFSYVKATDGQAGVDAYFLKNISGAKAAGIPVGAYHFFQPTEDAVTQAQNFLTRLFAANGSTTLEAGDLPAALDLEYTDGPALAPEAYIAAVQTWLDAVEAATGRRPVIYTSASFWNGATASSTAFGRYPLWVAEYGVATPKLPAGWTTYAIWQSGTGMVPGVNVVCDEDSFNGRLEELQALAGANG